MALPCQFEYEIKEMHKAIYGNGDPEKGLLWMVRKNTDVVQMIGRVFWPVLISAMVGAGAAVVNLLYQISIQINK